MHPMRVAVDWDGTVVRNTDLVLALVNYKHGTDWSSKDVTHWDWPVEELGDRFWEALDLIDRTDMRVALEPYDEDTPRVLDRLVEQGVDLEIVTANHEAAHHAIEAWLEVHCEHGAEVPVRCLGRTRATRKLELGFDVYVDDAPELAEAIPEHPGKHLLLMNCRWNEGVEDGKQVTRVRSWARLEEELGVLAEGEVAT